MRLRLVAVAGLSLITVLLFAPSVWSRPGGGQSYRGSSGGSRSSSSSYGGSRSSSSSSSYGGSRSSSSSYGTTGYSGSSSYGGSSSSSGDSSSALGVIFLIAIVVLVLWLIFRDKSGSGSTQRASVAVDDSVRRDALAKLAKIEPGFDEKGFLERVKQTMAKINDAWVKGNMGPVRRLVSDGVYVRFHTYLELNKHYGIRNMMVDWRVVDATVADAETDALWDTVHVKVVGEARDRDVSTVFTEAEAKAHAAQADKSQYEEVWSFVRRRGHKAKDGKTALTGDCPNCGAELPISDVVKCNYCSALVNSGEHDWVLAEITQPEEFSPYDSSMEPDGLPELRKRDASVSRQELEDRGSVVFWKWIEAQAAGKRDKLERFCLVPGEPTVKQVVYRQVAVGSAELTQLYTDDEAKLDIAEIEIVWSAAEGTGNPVNRTHYMQLARSTSALSKRGLSSLDCPNCGGALAESDAAKCSYCGEALTGGKHEWALQAIDGDVTDGEG